MASIHVFFNKLCFGNKYALYERNVFVFSFFLFSLFFTFRYPLVSDRTPVQLLDPGTFIHFQEFGSWYYYCIRYYY